MSEAFRERKEDPGKQEKPLGIPTRVIAYSDTLIFDRLRANLFTCNSEGCFAGPAGVTRGGLTLKIGENVQAVLANLNGESGTGFVTSIRFDNRSLDKIAGMFSDLLDGISKQRK